MITKELVFYIKQAKSLGKTNEQIRSTLLSSGGWTDADIEEGMRQSSSPQTAPQNSPLAAAQPAAQPGVLPIQPAQPIQAARPMAQTINPQPQNIIQPQPMVNPMINPIINPRPIAQPTQQAPIMNPRPYESLSQRPAAQATAFQPQPAAKHHGLRNFFLFLFLVLLIGGGAAGFYFKDEIKKMPIIRDFFPEGVTTTPMNTSLPAGTEKINTEKDCGADSACFDAAFRECQLASWNYVESGDEFKVKVMGTRTSDKLCRTSLTATKSVDSTLVGKSMTCYLDSTQNFSVAYVNATNCVGELVSALQGVTSEAPGPTSSTSTNTSAGTNTSTTGTTPPAATTSNTATSPGTASATNTNTCTLAGSTTYSSKQTIKTFTVADISLAVNTTNLITISGYKGTTDQIVWISNDPAISSTNVSSGSKVLAIGNKAGKTVIKATDASVGSKCSVTLNVTVSQ